MINSPCFKGVGVYKPKTSTLPKPLKHKHRKPALYCKPWTLNPFSAWAWIVCQRTLLNSRAFPFNEGCRRGSDRNTTTKQASTIFWTTFLATDNADTATAWIAHPAKTDKAMTFHEWPSCRDCRGWITKALNIPQHYWHDDGRAPLCISAVCTRVSYNHPSSGWGICKAQP